MWILVVFLWMIMPNSLYAANPYRLNQVDYFHQRSLPQASQEQNEIIDWKEPIESQDGRTTYYFPPAPVLALLDNPTPENAKAYLTWQKLKVEKIIKAQEAIEGALKEGESP